MKNKILSLILSVTLVLSVFVSFSVFFATPAAAVSYTADSSWYSASKSVLEINDIPDFVAFMNKLDELGSLDNGAKLGAAGNLAAISWTGKMPFEGQTIVLNTDINLNPGITFSSTGPNNTAAFKFSRTARQIGFGGIFDGQGHTISGLYIDAQKGGAGSIFGVAGAATKRTNVVVRNLQIKNSLIANTHMGAATIFSSVAFNSTALIQNVYSEAFVRCTATASSTDDKLDATVSGVNMGGLCATVGGTLTIDSSVYAGTFSTASGGGHKKYVGGLVGNITMKKLSDGKTYNAKLNVENSAYYGSYSGNGVYLGKISGNQTAGTVVTVNNSIFLGTMKSTATVTLGTGANSVASTYYVGRLIGDATSAFTLTLLTPEAGRVNPPKNAVISFSGGVADCIEQERPWLAFGDLGPELGRAIRESRLCQGEYVLGSETIRATVIGAGSHSAQLSGSTVFCQNVKLPLKNLPVVEVAETDTTAQILRNVQMQDTPPVLAMKGISSPGYWQVAELAEKLVSFARGPVYLALEEDMAKALGQMLALRMGKNARILCVDRVALTDGMYLDVGAPVGPALPVVVKTLVLGRQDEGGHYETENDPAG